MDQIGLARLTDSRRDPADDLVLPSRIEAIDRLKASVEAGDTPVLLTGEPGTGKSWVAARVIAALPVGWRWGTIALTPTIEAAELYRLIVHALGLPRSSEAVASRSALQDALLDASFVGDRWGLLVDEAHNGSDLLLEELRVLGNRLGQPGRFAALILVGQPSLIRRLLTRPLAAFDSRIAMRIALGRLTFDEFRTLLGRPTIAADSEMEWAHRATEGNPLRALRLVRSRIPMATAVPAAVEPARAKPTIRIDAPREAVVPNLPVVPPKPPIEVGEEMIEVGWEAGSESASESENLSEMDSPSRSDPLEESDDDETSGPDHPPIARVEGEPIDDRYAALQAWSEWSRNQGREPNSEPVDHDSELEEGGQGSVPKRTAIASGPPSHPGDGQPSVWAEGQHGFAPYSQLFTRLRQQRDSQ